MTGYGRAKEELNNRIYQIDIKSVNHKYSDITIKMPRTFSYLEDKIRKEINASIARGKVDVFISFENYSEEGKQVILNKELVKEYMKQFKILAEENTLSMNFPVTEITKLPDVLILKETEVEEETIETELLQTLKEAISNFVTMRELEGIQIKQDLLERINRIEPKVQKISEFSSRLLEEYVVKLEKRIKEVLKTDVIDESRLATEVVIYADKCSVEEELTRLKSHISQFKCLLEENRSSRQKNRFFNSRNE